MFGIFKSSSKNDFEYHCDAMNSQIQKAFKKFLDADKYLSGQGVFKSPSKINSSVHGAMGKAKKSLTKAMWNADDALKAIKKDTASLEDEVFSLDFSCQKHTGYPSNAFRTDEVEKYWDESFKNWLSEYEDLKGKYGITVGIKQASSSCQLDPDDSLSECDKGEFTTSQEEEEYRFHHKSAIICAMCTGQQPEDVIRKIKNGQYPGEKRGDMWFVPNEVVERINRKREPR
ncbi:hypothetical protein [Desulfogranum marinum]|uniref:hypothetical protein n=1 Tax=Desulfogranum marinum TaxID=453220 RepID=UPI00196251CC|nr:hypothetical protein [Desulfogranum marinum]MBM9514727.1 hypothetical protein [Desulfogranum marinum]